MSNMLGEIGEAILTTFKQGEYFPELRTQLWVPKDTPKMPFVMVYPPEAEFPGGPWGDGGEGESRIGTFQWNLTYTCSLWIELDDATKAQQKGVELAQGIVETVQYNPSLGGVVDTAKVSSFSLEIGTVEKGSHARIMHYEFNVEVIKEVAQQEW